MRRLVVTVLMVMLALLPFTAGAQNTVTGSGFQVQNLNESQAANIVVTYYNADGTVNATQSQQIPAGGALTFFNGQGGTIAMSATAGFKGAVVISSDQPIAAITNLIGAGIGDSYGGFSTGGQTINVPLVTRNNFGDSTAITVQNTGTASTTVNVAYTPGVIGNTGVTDSQAIPAGSSFTFLQANKTELGDRFVGSATITAGSGGSIVAIVNNEGNNKLQTYNAFNAGGTTIAVPLLVANNFGAFTGLQVQNSGTNQTSVTVTYSANSVTTPGNVANVCGTPPASTFTLAAGASKTLIQLVGDEAEGFNNFFNNCRYVGGATVTASEPLVAIVNQVSGTSSSAYESFATANSTGTVKVPLAIANNFGDFTGIQVQNVGTAETTVTLTYGPNTVTDPGNVGSACPTPASRTATIPAGASKTFIQAAFGPAEDGFDSQFNNCRYVGSATITAGSGGKIAAIVNQVASANTDSLFTYNAFNQ